MKRNWFYLALISLMLFSAGNGRAMAQDTYGLGIYGQMNDMVTDNNSDVHICWVNMGVLYYGKLVSTSSGYAVEPQEKVAQGVSVIYFRPRMSVTPDGKTVHIVWDTNQSVTHGWRDASGNWMIDLVRSRGMGANYCMPAVGEGFDGMVHIITSRWGNDPTDGGPVLYLYKPAGGDWSNDLRISRDDTSEYRHTAMFVDPSGGIHAVWGNGDLKGNPLWYQYAPPGGKLTDTERLGVDPQGDVMVNYAGEPFVEANGTVHVVYTGWVQYGTKGNMIEYAYKLPGASEFVYGGRPSCGMIDSEFDPWPCIAVDMNGKVYTAWLEFWGEYNNALIVSILENGAWTLQSFNDGYIPEDREGKPSMVATDQGSTIYVLYRSRNDDEFRLVEFNAIGVHSPTNITWQKQTERSFFRKKYINIITWENHNFNISHNVVITKFKIYRKLKTESKSSYAFIGEVAGSVYTYADSKGVTEADSFDYTVTAVDDKGQESKIR